MAEKLNQYEAMFLLGPIGTAEPETSLNMCKGVIERHGGQIILIKKWDERKLMYELEGQKRGTYIISFFRAPTTAISGIERDVKLSEDILRVLVLKADHLNEQEMAAVEPQVPAPREERPSYDRGFDRPPFEGGEGRPPRAGGFSRPPRREESPEAGAAKEGEPARFLIF
jgi:small subunit ribosomal protein S6